MNTHALKEANWRFYAVVAVGLACLNIWSDLVGHGLAFVPPAETVGAVTNGRVFFSLGLGSAAFAFAVFARRLAALGDRLLIALALGGTALTVLYALCPGLPAPASVVAGIVGSYGVGFGYGSLLVLLLCRLAESASIAAVALVGTAALLLKTILDLPLGLLPTMAQIAFVALLPAVCVACVLAAQRMPERGGAPIDIAEVPKAGGDNERLLLAILIMNAVLHAVTRSMSTLGFWGNGYILAGVPSLGLVASAAILVFAVRYTMCDESNPNMLTRFLPAFLVLLGGFFMLDPQITSLLGLPDGVVEVVRTVVELYAHTLYWVIIVTAIRCPTSHPYRTAGIPVTVMCVTAVVLGLMFQVGSNDGGGSVQINSMVVMVAMYAFTAVIVFLFRGTENDSMALTDAAAGEKSVEGRLKALAEERGLSPRETEVFILLAQGRDRNFITGELFISDATVKTHSKHIYAKLGVHSKQELISVVQERLAE